GIETEDVLVMTRPGETVLATPPEPPRPGGPIAFPGTADGRYTVYGSKPDHAAGPSRPVTGVVRDLDTGQPVPGAVVTLQGVGGPPDRRPVHVWTTADAEGRYTLTGAPVRKGCLLSVQAPADQPYLAAMVDVPNPAGGGPIPLDPTLKRGAWAKVRVFDKADKKPVLAQLSYFALADNPHLKGVRTILARRAPREGDEYRIVILPGPGIVAANTWGEHPFVSLVSRRAAPIAAWPFPFRPQDYLGYARINPAADAKEVTVEIGLTRGTDE
ncbi:MAG TPA: carboxypeptidase-like regulatory domain-containing protein, partial [Gemmataceae bacterium]|nr:carboxypeptidase-like regulatory domain-containing protein [Gemmataceae bacterium]